MANKQPEEKDDFLGLINKIWSPIAALIGGITLIYNFYKLWQGDQSTITYFLVGSGLIILTIVLIFIIKRTRIITHDRPHPFALANKEVIPFYSPIVRKFAIGGLYLLATLFIIGTFLLIQHQQTQEKFIAEQEKKLIVLIAGFEGPEDVYGLRNEIIESLNADFSDDENIEVISIDEIITLSQGSEYARQLGYNYLADIVIWGWYRPTENPNINIHIENLSLIQLLILGKSETFQPITTLSELETFSFQQQTGDETSALISFLAGFIEYDSENYEKAIQYFDTSLETLSVSTMLFENQYKIYFYRGSSKSFLGDYQSAIQDYDQVIQINPQRVDAYNNRGVAYYHLGEFQNAIQDFNQTIQIIPQYGVTYNNRGLAYVGLGDYERAIQDYDQAIQINPQDAVSYYNRGQIYALLNDYERAIQDYGQAIRINPQFVEAYISRGAMYSTLGKFELAINEFNSAIQINPQSENAYLGRGFTYMFLKQYEQAIQDFDQVIRINPQFVEAYISRGLAYYILGKYESAIQDFDKAIQINPQYAQTYYDRGITYQALGKNAEAEADFAKYEELTGEDAP